MNLGHDHPDDLAFDVDENTDEEDQAALDSDDEQALDEELGIDSNGESNSNSWPNTYPHFPQKFPCMLCRCTLSYQVRNKCMFLSLHHQDPA